MQTHKIEVPLISVIMPVYNAEKYLREAIDSILSQIERNFELIIINDGSTDASLSIIEEYENLDSRVKVISQKNKGLVYSLNLGIKEAKGKYIARMDADDISLENRFKEQVKLMRTDNLDICGCDFSVINEHGSIVSTKKVNRKNFALVLMCNVPFAHGSVMIKKDFLIKNDLKYGQTIYNKAEDYQLWREIFECGGVFGNVSKHLFQYRDVEDSLSSNKNNMYHASMISYEFMKKNEKQITQCILTADHTEIVSFRDQIAFFALLTIFDNYRVKCSLIPSKRIFLKSLIRALKVYRIRLLSKFND